MYEMRSSQNYLFRKLSMILYVNNVHVTNSCSFPFGWDRTKSGYLQLPFTLALLGQPSDCHQLLWNDYFFPQKI